MKSLFVIISLMLLCIKSREVYSVCYVSDPGKILFARTNQEVKVTNKITDGEELKFMDVNASLIVIDGAQHRRVVSLKQPLNNRWSGMIAELKRLLFPPLRERSFLTRAGDFKGYDPRDYFSTDETCQKLMLIREQKIPIRTDYKMDASHFFFIQFNDGEQRVVRKIPQNDHNIFFDELVFLSKISTPVSYSLCYQSVKLGKSTSEKIVDFTPVFVDSEEVRNVLRAIVGVSSNKSSTKMNNLVLTHFYETYGKIGIEMLRPLYPD